jgi:glycosyltransferase involved in cell wall biosynthesis
MNKPEQTLVILSPAFPANESETTWVPAQQLLVKELKDQFPDLNVMVISFLYPYKKSEYYWHDVKVISFGGMYKRRLKRLQLWIKIWKQLNKIKKENHVIGLLSFWCGECALIGSWFAKRNKLKHFCWICGQDAKRSNKYIRRTRPKPEELVAISDFLMDEFHTNHSIKPAHLIPIAIQKKMFPGWTGTRDIDIIGVGSLIPLKNFDIFVSVIAELKKIFPSIKVVLCGAGSEEEKIKSLAKQLNVYENISFPGMLPHSEVLQWMQRSKILLHPSSYEGFGMVYLEALYAGAHAIGFTKAMHHEIKNWHIVKTKKEMVEKARALLQDTGLSHENVLVYSIEDSAKAFMELFLH